MTLSQLMLMLILKFKPYILTLWAVPAIQILLLLVHARAFPPFRPAVFASLPAQLIGTEPLVALVCALWVYAMRCVITPVCGEGSRYFFDA